MVITNNLIINKYISFYRIIQVDSTILSRCAVVNHYPLIRKEEKGH